jgi:hypothetical protein
MYVCTYNTYIYIYICMYVYTNIHKVYMYMHPQSYERTVYTHIDPVRSHLF